MLVVEVLIQEEDLHFLCAFGEEIDLEFGISACRAVERAAGQVGAKISEQAHDFDGGAAHLEQALGLLLVLVQGLPGAQFGRLDGLVCNASSFFPTPMGEIDETAWHDLVGSNFKAPLFLAQAAAPHLRAAGGAIVNMTDIHAERPLAGYPLYTAAKGALLTLTRALAVELAPEVRVNAVAPGPILWPEDGQFPVAERDAIVQHTLLKRAGSPEDIARTVRFLMFDAPYITGQVINVDGGRSAHLAT